MKKLRLAIDALQVESFPVARAGVTAYVDAGTSIESPAPCPYSEGPQPTCYNGATCPVCTGVYCRTFRLDACMGTNNGCY